MHAGVDIFAKKGTPVHPAIGGIVIATTYNFGAGGNSVVVFSSGFRFHYYAHLSEIDTHMGAIVTQNSTIGKVGNTGNAAGKPHHLHYGITSFIPQGDWRWEPRHLVFYINPIKEMEKE
jgi:murein DD-endopeptidase MepM/ murein hydrolase activator NlpD